MLRWRGPRRAKRLLGDGAPDGKKTICRRPVTAVKADASGQQRRLAAHVRPSHSQRNDRLARDPRLAHQGRLRALHIFDHLLPGPGADRAGLDTRPGREALGPSTIRDPTQGGQLTGRREFPRSEFRAFRASVTSTSAPKPSSPARSGPTSMREPLSRPEQDEYGTSQTSIRHHPPKQSAMRPYAVAPIHTGGVALRHVGPRDAT
jgi:hypothetical protein